MKKLLLVLSILFLTSLSIFAENWGICFGEYKSQSQAEVQQNILTKQGIHTKIEEYTKNSTETFYRVLSLEVLPSRQAAIFQKELLLNHSIIRNLNINDISLVTVEGPKVSNFNTKELDAKIQQMQNELQSVYSKLSNTQNELQKTQKDLQLAKNEINKLKNTISKMQKPAVQKSVAPTPAPKPQAPVVVPQEVVKELPKNRVIVVRDSDTGNPVPYADVNIDDTWDLQSDSAGQVPLPNEIQEGEHKLTVTKGDEYVPTEDVFVVAKGEITSAPQISIPKAVDFKRIKIILDWGEFPWDLDAHVVDGTNHVFFSVKEEGNLELDRDDVNSFGPETITIIEPKKDKVYSYYVHDCSNAGNNESVRLSNSKAQVRVYFDNEFKTSFKITPNKKGLSWHVFDIEDGDKIVKKGKISTKKPSEY